MGFFSWRTSDTGESIRNVHAEGCQTVYLLQPDGQEPFEESAYEGYGVFGGMDAYEWLALANLPPEYLKRTTGEQLRDAGVALDCGHLLRTNEGKLYAIFGRDEMLYKALGLEVDVFPIRWDEPIPGIGKSANDLIDEGLAESVKMKELVEIRRPLKFSFDHKAKYEELPAAERDPAQGFFEEDDSTSPRMEG